jgi:ecotin
MTPRLALAAFAALTATAVASLAGNAAGTGDNSQSYLAEYPASQKGLTRFVLHLPVREKEADLKVEFFAGLQQEWSCNRPFMQTEIKTRDVKGWGFKYFIASWDGKFASNLVACLGSEVKETSFIHGSGTLIDYNSKLPVVVFAPKDLSVRFRIWNAGATEEMAESGVIGTTDTAEADMPEGKGGRLSVKSTQIKGTKVIRKQDKYGNKINFTQSD